MTFGLFGWVVDLILNPYNFWRSLFVYRRRIKEMRVVSNYLGANGIKITFWDQSSKPPMFIFLID
jgi:hypothetical protein